MDLQPCLRLHTPLALDRALVSVAATVGAMKYRVVVADPPWNYNNAGCRGAAENHYPTMSVQDICDLPVDTLADDDAALFLWTTWPQLREGLEVVRAWGFDYVTGLPWLKIIGAPSVDLWGDLTVKAQYGVGFWVRGCTEPLLIAKRGNVAPQSGDLVGLLSENLRHSRKPENVYHIAERLPGPYVELFARRPRVGWDVWGNQVSSVDLGVTMTPAYGIADDDRAQGQLPLFTGTDSVEGGDRQDAFVVELR